MKAGAVGVTGISAGCGSSATSHSGSSAVTYHYASCAATVNLFKRQVPKQGFKLLDFEVDSPNDSEGTDRGYGKIGRWQLRSLPGCPRAMSFAASAEPSR